MVVLTNKQITDQLQVLQDQLDELNKQLGYAPGAGRMPTPTIREQLDETTQNAQGTDSRLKTYENNGLKYTLPGGYWLFGNGEVALTRAGIEFLNDNQNQALYWHGGPFLGITDTIARDNQWVQIAGQSSGAALTIRDVADQVNSWENDLYMVSAPTVEGWSYFEFDAIAGLDNQAVTDQSQFFLYAQNDSQHASGVSGATIDFRKGMISIGPGLTETLSADQNNFLAESGSGLIDGDLYTIWRFNLTADRNITGIKAPFNKADTNAVHIIANVGSANLVLKNASGSSSANNQFALAGDITLLPKQAVPIIYDMTTLKWRVLHVSDILHDAAWDAKGDLITGTSADTGVKTSVGSNGYFLNADSSQSGGIAWNPLTVNNDIAASISANTDDWAPTGISTASVIRVTTDASRNLTGITTGADGRVLVLLNVGTHDLVLKDNVTSTASNRFQLNGDQTLAADEGCTLIYDSTTSFWRMAGMYHVTTGSGSVATDTIWDAKGDLAVGTGADTASALTVGANDSILMADSAQSTGLKWAAAATTTEIADVTTGAESAGTSDTYARGDHVHHFAGSGGDITTDTAWAAKGDLIVGTANDTAAILTVGSNTQVLTADSTQSTGMKWAAAAGGGSETDHPFLLMGG